MSDSDTVYGENTIPHGDSAALFPVDDLDARTWTGRDAKLRLDETVPRAILTVAPTGMAIGYFLAQHTLTVVDVESLPPTVVREVETAGFNICRYDLVRIGQEAPTENRSLSEFGDEA